MLVTFRWEAEEAGCEQVQESGFAGVSVLLASASPSCRAFA